MKGLISWCPDSKVEVGGGVVALDSEVVQDFSHQLEETDPLSNKAISIYRWQVRICWVCLPKMKSRAMILLQVKHVWKTWPWWISLGIPCPENDHLQLPKRRFVFCFGGKLWFPAWLPPAGEQFLQFLEEEEKEKFASFLKSFDLRRISNILGVGASKFRL